MSVSIVVSDNTPAAEPIDASTSNGFKINQNGKLVLIVTEGSDKKLITFGTTGNPTVQPALSSGQSVREIAENETVTISDAP